MVNLQNRGRVPKAKEEQQVENSRDVVGVVVVVVVVIKTQGKTEQQDLEVPRSQLIGLKTNKVLYKR